MDRAEKREVVTSLHDAFAKTGVIVVAHYAGLSVSDMTKFRRDIRGVGGEVKVAKNRLAKLALEGTNARGIADLGIIGPAPAYIWRLRGRYRWQLILRGSDPADFLAPIALPPGWTVDIDPVGLIQ